MRHGCSLSRRHAEKCDFLSSSRYIFTPTLLLLFSFSTSTSRSLTVLGDFSDRLFGVSHPTSLQFCPEIGLNCDSICLLEEAFLPPCNAKKVKAESWYTDEGAV